MANKLPMQEEEVLSLKPQGLYTYPNQLSAVPQGALKEAINTVLDRPFVLEQRRGIVHYGDPLVANPEMFFNFQNKIIVHHGSTLSYDSDNLGTWVDYSGTYDAPVNALKIHSISANKNIYFTTDDGIKKLDIVTGSIADAGAPAGLDGSGTTTGSGWFTNSTQVAYRILFGYTDVNGNLILGAPSQRIVVSNNSGSATNVSLTFTLPAGLTTAWEYRIYRSPMSVDLNTEPNDECALVYTGNPTSGELTAGTITVTDSINDSLKGEMIYTASSQQGIAQANTQPPIATDFAVFQGFTFYANLTYQQQLFLTLVSVGGTGLALNDTITIGTITYTAKAAESIASAQFELFTGGTPSQNITNTANSLIRVINRHTASVVYAYYKSGYADLPGRILITERGIGGTAFTISCSKATAFTPDLSSPYSSSTESAPNKLAISKFQQPEAQPTLQTLPVGSADKSILRIIALRDYLIIFKQDGVYQVVGTDISSFQIQLVDSTIALRGIETAVALNNKVYCFTNQTVCSITYNEGAILKSQPIKKDLLILSSSLYPNFDTVSYGISYESDNKYILGTVKETTDTVCTQYYVYNYLTDSWTTWEHPVDTGTGFVNPTDDKLYFGTADAVTPSVFQERKNFATSDYADFSFPVTIVSSSNLIVEVTDTTDLVAGYTLQQVDKMSVITEVIDLTHIEVTDNLPWVAGAATVFMPIIISIKFVPEACGNPGLVKHFKEIHGIFAVSDFSTLDVGCGTDFNGLTSSMIFNPRSQAGWGQFQWGQQPWGIGLSEMQVIRGYVPLDQRRGHWINLSIDYSVALTNFGLDGFVVYYQKSAQKFH